MKERLDNIKERYDYLCEELLKPEIYEDYKKMQVVQKEKNSIENVVQTYKKYNSLPLLEIKKNRSHTILNQTD